MGVNTAVGRINALQGTSLVPIPIDNKMSDESRFTSDSDSSRLTESVSAALRDVRPAYQDDQSRRR